MLNPSKNPKAGMLLIAEPMLNDPNFKRSVILLCEHNVEGSFGLVLNRITGLKLADVIDDLPDFGKDLYLGGPVQPETLHVIHRAGKEVPSTLEVFGNVKWGGDFEQMKTLLETFPDRNQDFRFFLGYSGWGPDQLQNEIDSGGWVLTSATEEIIFTEDSEKMWRIIMKQLGGEYALFSNFPDDPGMN